MNKIKGDGNENAFSLLERKHLTADIFYLNLDFKGF